MKFHDGTAVTVLGQIQIEQKPFNIIKLPGAEYIHGRLIRYAVFPLSDFERDKKDDLQEIINEVKVEEIQYESTI
jgi:hypothetical protein